MRLVTLSVCTALVLGGLTGTAYAHPAQDCYSYGAQNVADIRSYYSSYDRSVVVQQTQYDANTSWICAHAGLSGLGGGGGKFIVTGVALTPTVDGDVSVCPTSSDLLAGQVGDPGNPSTYLPYRVASVSDSTTVTICVTLGSTAVRATYPVNPGQTPTVNFQQTTSSTAPFSVVGSIPAGAASSTCRGGNASPTDSANLAWYALYGGTQGFVQLYSSKVCYRSITPSGTRGGYVTYSTGSIDVWVPVETGSTTNCTTTVSSTSAPVPTKISTGSGAGRSWICAEALSNSAALAARGDATLPNISSPPSVSHVQD